MKLFPSAKCINETVKIAEIQIIKTWRDFTLATDWNFCQRIIQFPLFLVGYFQWTLSCTLSCPLSSGLGSGMSSHVYPPQEQLKIRMVNITNSKLRPLREQTSKLFLWPTQTTLPKHSLLGFNCEIIQRAVFRVFCTAFQYSSLNVWSNFLNLLQYSKLGGGLIWPLPFLGEH